MARGVSDVDRGYREAIRALGDLRDVSAVVGIRQEKGADRYHAEGKPGARRAVDGGDATLAEVATFLEFGTAEIPARPFLRDTFDVNRARYEVIVTRGVRHALARPGAIRAELVRTVEVVGAAAVGDVQEAIATRGAFAPNAESTIARKGSSMPLIDTGRLRQSIDYAIEENGPKRPRRST